MEKIDRYLQGEMTEAEERLFRDEVANHPALAEELTFMQGVQRSIAQKERAALKAHLASLEPRPKYFRWVAAAVVLLAFVGYWAWTQQPSQVAQAYFQPLPNMIQPIVRGEQDVSEAFLAYEREDYAEAERAFAQLEEEHAALYRGICLLALGRPEEAAKVLGARELSVEAQGLEDYRRWYLALSLLQVGQKEEATALLESLVTSIHPVAKQASALLARL
jgi:tetratricopeptide (TPR) repeat protein